MVSCMLTFIPQPAQNKPLAVHKTFNLDQLPFYFGSAVEPSSDNTAISGKCSEGAKVLSEMVWQAGGFRFRKLRSDSTFNLFTYKYKCCQDKGAFDKFAVNLPKRDRQRMLRFDCQSSLSFRVSLESRTLALEMHHHHHPPLFR